MTVPRQIVVANIDDLPRVEGFNMRRLDDSHTEIYCCDHPMWGRRKGETGPANKTQSDLDDHVASLGVETVADHPESPSTIVELRTPSDHPLVDTAPFPGNVAFDGDDHPAEDSNEVVVWDRG